MSPPEVGLIAEALDPDGKRVVVSAAIWYGKIAPRHPDVLAHLSDVLRAIGRPDVVIRDPRHPDRRRHFLRGAGPSEWLLVVLSYEQEPVRLISAYPNRKDPPQ